MSNFCRKCGNKLLPNGKFCTKCGTPIPKNEPTLQNPISNEAIQEVVGNVKEAVKEKATQAVQYSQEVMQNEQFRNEQAEAIKEKAKNVVQQSQEYLKSEQFQNAKTKTVNNTKSFVRSFFSCNINDYDDYVKAEMTKRRCTYMLLFTIAVVLFFGPLYSVSWGNGILKPILALAGSISHIVSIFFIPVLIISAIKYFITYKAVKGYKTVNPNISCQLSPFKVKEMAILLVVCVVCSGCFTVIEQKYIDKTTQVSREMLLGEDAESSEISTSSENWVSGKEIDVQKNATLYSDILKAFDTKRLSNGQTLGEVMINEMLLPGGAAISVKTGDKVDKYIVKISGRFKVSDVTVISQDLTFNINKEESSYLFTSADRATIHFVDVLVPQYLGY